MGYTGVASVPAGGLFGCFSENLGHFEEVTVAKRRRHGVQGHTTSYVVVVVTRLYNNEKWTVLRDRQGSLLLSFDNFLG